MLRNYLTLAARQLRKHTLYSAINILGLSFGIAIFLVLWCYIGFETSFDTHHEKADRLYQLNTTLYSLEHDPFTAWDVAPALQQSVPAIKNTARLHWSDGIFTMKNSSGDKKKFHEGSVWFADNSLFQLFTFKPIAGNLAEALTNPYTIVLSRTLAAKMFSDPSEAIGKTIDLQCEWIKGEVMVTAVIEDAEKNSSLNYTSFVSMDPLIQSSFYQTERRWNNFFTYVELEDPSLLQKVNDAMPGFISEYKSGEKLTYKPEVYLQPVTDMHLSHRDPRQGKDMSNIYLFMTVAIIVIAIAWVNYVNLSTARSMERAREVGVKKALGVMRKDLVTQFMVESLTVNIVSLMIAVVLALLFLPVLNDIASQQYDLELTSWNQVTTLFGLLMFGTLVSGLYPAIMLSSFRTTEVIKGIAPSSAGGFSLRKGLIIFQFTASLCLLICTAAITQQVTFMKEQDKGLNTSQVLVVPGPEEATGDIEHHFDTNTLNERTKSFKNSLLQLPSVEQVSTSGVVPGGSYNHSTHMDIIGKAPEEITPGENTYVIFSDMDFMSVYKMTLLEGRDWDSKKRTDLNNVLVNEATVAAFKLGTNSDAIGQRIVVLRDTMNIIGVVKNFYWESLKVTHHPIVLYPFEIFSRRISVLVNGDIDTTIEQVRSLYSQHYPGSEFDYFFADDNYNELYDSDIRFGTIFGIFTTFAMIVACLGLFGMATFTTHQRSREISIRKVLGASINSIMLLLSTQFGKLLIAAIVLSVPMSWFLVSRWLESYPVRIELSWWLFALPSMVLLLILTATVVVQVYRGASINPAKVLRG